MRSSDLNNLLTNYYSKYIESENKDKIINEVLEDVDIRAFLLLLTNKYLANFNENIKVYQQDFFQDAQIALNNAFKEFNPTLNVPFYAYVTQSITYAFQQQADSLQDIKRSKGVTQNIKILARLIREYPNQEETVRTKFKEKTGICHDSTVDWYYDMLNSGTNTLSLDYKEVESESSYIDTVVSSALNPLEMLLDESKREIMERHLKNDLSPKEYEYLTRYIGWHRKAESLQEIANSLGVTKQNISYYVRQAESKLKESSLEEELNKFR
ncbi:MAG: sigma-70 family RNA polymerase sigma factor [Acholeplasmatales bacterium]|nr:sigma-70 family RNA polymerase sigma factor [Acholeplasmatales bacterium]